MEFGWRAGIKKLLLIPIICIALIDPGLGQSAFETCKVWVFFVDKGIVSPDDCESALRHLNIPERTLQRRAKVSAGASVADLPLCEAYVNDLRRKVISVHQESRWLNGISVTVNERQLIELRKLPFVKAIRPVAKAQSASHRDWQESVFWEGGDIYNEKFLHLGQEGAFYGESYDQLDQIGVIEMHRRGFFGQGVLIAIFDGGFLLDHRCFAHAEVIAEWDFINDDAFTGFDPAQDVRGQPTHGTACMSNIAAYDPGNLIGCAPYASFLLAKTEDVRSETPAEEDNWIAALEWAEWNGADIISSSLSYLDWYNPMSFDGETPPASKSATEAYKMGVVICNSVGNGGPRPRTLGTPADAEGVLAIGAIDSNYALVGFSSRGPTADERIKPNVCAMGRHVTVARSYTFNQFGLANGTSFSCPLAAGAIALLIEAHPDWPSSKIYEAVENTATQAYAPDNDWGYGILQVHKAMDYPAVSGYVKGETGNSLNKAEISFAGKDTSGTVETDRSGFYLIPCLPEGEYRIKARATGYEESEESIAKLPPEEVRDFKLKSKFNDTSD
jgi:hypothetical protein